MTSVPLPSIRLHNNSMLFITRKKFLVDNAIFNIIDLFDNSRILICEENQTNSLFKNNYRKSTSKMKEKSLKRNIKNNLCSNMLLLLFLCKYNLSMF